MTAEDVRWLRGELADMIGEIATLEGWLPGHLGDVMTRAMRGPLADLLPNLHYFKRRLAEIDAEREALELLNQHTWRGEGLDERRWCPGCDGSCVGTRRCSCQQKDK